MYKVNNEWWLKKTAIGLLGSVVIDNVPDIQKYIKSNDPSREKEAELAWQREALAASPEPVVGVGAAALGAGAAALGAGAAASGARAAASGTGAAALGAGAAALEENMPTVDMPSPLPPVDPAALVAKAGELAESMKGVDLMLSGEAVEAAMGVIGNLASVAERLPCVGPLIAPMRLIVEAAREARYNKLAAKSLANRVQELGAALFDLLKAVQEPSPSLDLELQRLVPKLNQCRAFLASFSKRSYLGKMLGGHSDGMKLKLLDKDLTDSVQAISLSLGVTQVEMAERTFERLDQLEQLIKMSRGSPQLEADSPVVAAIAQTVGIDIREVVGQLQFSLDAIATSQAEINAKLDAALATQGAATEQDQAWQGAPEDPRAFWSDYFAEKTVAVELFIPVFEEEFLPEDVDELTPQERSAFVAVIDAYPCDGVVSIVEWKRLCKASRGRSLYGYVKALAANDV